MIATVAIGVLLAQAPLTIDHIMQGPALVGYAPEAVRWAGNGRLYFQWKQASDAPEKELDTYTVESDGAGLRKLTEPRKLTEEDARLAPPAGGDENKSKTQVVFERGGDIFLYDRPSDRVRQLTRTVEAESNPHFVSDAKRIYFTRANNLYALALDSATLTQMTDIRPVGTVVDDPDKKGTDSQEVLKKEERGLLAVVAERARKRQDDEAKRKRENPRKPYVLKAGESVAALELTPGEQYVVALFKHAPEDAKKTAVPNYVTESAYTEDIPSRSKVGDKQERTSLAVIAVDTGEMKPVVYPLSGTEEKNVTPADLQLPVWSEDGTKAVLLARSVDNKDRWILALDAATAKVRVLANDHDDAWLGGPGSNALGWMQGDREIFFQSERLGYSHLYAVSWDGGAARALTSGNWEVLDARLSRDKSRFLLLTNEAGTGENQCYELPAAGGERRRLTAASGHHACTLSPDEKWIADVYSYTNKPPELYVQANAAGADARRLTTSPAPAFGQYPWTGTPEFVIAARDGAPLHAKLFKPANAKPGGPGVVFVHGAGYLQDIEKAWSYYYREYLFHHFLMERGYTVMEVDYRGSAGYGRDWRTGIYRNMGGKDLEDNVDAARWLVAHAGVDPKRIGIYGGSYGGFITLMAMFTTPDVFAAGAALRPVTDWAHYDDEYTSDILNRPQGDAEAYRRSSPIYFANGLKGALLICHGVADTNVHFQDTVRLAQKLIELRKENWEVAMYPAEDHGFRNASSWADEYKRIFALFERNLKK